MRTFKALPKGIIITTLIAAISACGGGSGSSTNTGNTDTPTATPPASQAPPVYTFRAPITYRNECGDRVPHPIAEVLLHDDNWNIIERASPGADGMVEFTVDDQFLNVTVVSSDRDADHSDLINDGAQFNVSDVQVVSFDIFPDLEMKDYSAIHNLNYDYYPTEPQNALCNCVEGELTVIFPEEGMSLGDVFLPGYDFGNLNSRQSTDDYSVCKNGESWPVYWVTASNGPRQYLGVVSDFDELAQSGQQLLHVDHQPTIIELPADLGGFNQLRHYNILNESIYRFEQNIGNTIPYFESERSQSGALVNNGGSKTENLDGFSVYYHKRTFSEDPFDVTTLVNDLSFPQFTEENINQLFDTNTFDFRNATDLPFFWIDLRYFAPEKTVRFRFNGITNGSLPDVELYTGYEEHFTDITTADLALSFFDYRNISSKTEAAFSTNLFSLQPITVENYETHYRKDFELIEIRFDAINLNE